MAERVDVLRHLDAVAGGGHGGERVEERFEHGEIGGRAGIAGIRREVEQDDADLALGPGAAAQADEAVDAGGEGGGALRAGLHLAAVAVRGEAAEPVAAGAGLAGAGGAAAEDGRLDGAVDLGDRHHDGVLDGQQPAARGAPFLQRLELQRMGGDVGHVELDQRRLGGSRVVVGGAADQREAGERDHRVDGGAAVVEEEALDGGARIEAAGKGRNDGEAARLEGGDDAVIVGVSLASR